MYRKNNSTHKITSMRLNSVRVIPTRLEADEGFHGKIDLPQFFMDIPTGVKNYSSDGFLNGSDPKKIKDIIEKDSFFSSMRPILTVFQIFALLPVSGINESSSKIKFSWSHWKTFYAFVSMGCILFMLIVNTQYCVTHGFSYDRSSPLVFYGCCLAGAILFLDLARHWRRLNECYEKTDVILANLGQPVGQSRKFLIYTIIYGFIALVEHTLSKLTHAMGVLECNADIEPSLQIFFIHHYPQLFEIVDYNAFVGIFALYINFSSSVCWNFKDLFVGLMAMSISSRLSQINKHANEFCGRNMPSAFWRKMREQYNAISVLTKEVDRNIQLIMLLSLGDSLFFLCLQLLKSLQPQGNVLEVIYFFWSFALLLVRIVFVTMCAAGIYDESRECKYALYSVPHESFCGEVKRFLMQITTDELVLTGCRFFSVTRALLFTIAGTVITYEIVLVQFKTDVDSFNPTENATNPCSLFLPPT